MPKAYETNPAAGIHFIEKAKKKADAKASAFWWGKVDSDHRSRRQQIYSLPPLAAREFPQILITAQRTANIKQTHMQSALSEKRLELVKGFEPPT